MLKGRIPRGKFLLRNKLDAKEDDREGQSSELLRNNKKKKGGIQLQVMTVEAGKKDG